MISQILYLLMLEDRLHSVSGRDEHGRVVGEEDLREQKDLAFPGYKDVHYQSAQ